MTAGLDFTSGEAAVVIDADLQDPPEMILEMIERWKAGYQVVYAVREQRKGESWFKLMTARIEKSPAIPASRTTCAMI